MKLRLHDIVKMLFLSLSLVLFCIPGPLAEAASSTAPSSQIQSIQALEDSLYTVRYDQEGVESRIARLEQTVFGQPQLGLSIDARIKKLQSVLSTDLNPLTPNPAPIASTAPATQTRPAVQPQQQATTYQAPKAGESDYPTVTQMEQKVFGRHYIGEDISQRLARLEKQVFKTPQNGPLADRMDNLRLVVLGDTGAESNVATASDGTMYRQTYTAPPNVQSYPAPGPQGRQGQRYTQVFQTNPRYNANNVPLDPGMNGYQTANTAMNSPYSTPPNMGAPATYGNPPMTGGEYAVSNTGPYGNPDPYANSGGYNVNAPATPDMVNAMSEVEKEVLGHTYDADPVRTRLDRLETKIFHTTSPEMSDDERLQRVIAVAAADGSNPSTPSKAKATFQTLLPIILTILPMLLL